MFDGRDDLDAAVAAPSPDGHPIFARLVEVARAAAGVDLDRVDGGLGATTPASVLAASVARGMELLGELEAAAPKVADVVVEDGPEGWPSVEAPTAPGRQLADLAFAGTMELRAALRDLGCVKEPDDVLVAAERARRKLQRSIRMVLEAAREAGEPHAREALRAAGPILADSASAAAVRARYADFRRSLRRASEDSPEAVLGALRYAAFALATIVTSPEFSELRASDRAILKRLRERVFAWSRGAREVSKGLELLADIETTADLLRSISQRQELRSHDARLASRLAGGPGGDFGAWVEGMGALKGRDDALDALVEQARRGGDPSELTPRMVVRLAEIRAS